MRNPLRHFASKGGPSHAFLRELVVRGTATTASQLSSDTSTMSCDELRGYVRARAWNVIYREITRRKDSRQLLEHEIEGLIAVVIERVVHHLVHNLFLTPVPGIWLGNDQSTGVVAVPFGESSRGERRRPRWNPSLVYTNQTNNSPASSTRRAAA